MPPDIARAASQATQVGPLSRPGTADHMRSRSETVLSKGGRRPRSRGSTASIHSSTTQQTQDQHVIDGYSQFMQGQQATAGHHVFSNNPEEIIMRFGQQLSHPTAGASTLDPTFQDSHHMPRPEDFPSHAIHGHSMSHQSLTPDLAAHGLPAMPVPQYPTMYDSGIENHVPEHMLEENENSEPGARKRKGSSATLANDSELRRLLRQYEGYTLKQMAAEVLKHEGAGGKSEKVKQVFAMIWLRENCRKSSGSVRRDRVYCCYAEKCGTERVSVLNPASFGKLVRIIFPNVQTRRLGVRGESKYHYVDLTVIEEKQELPSSLNLQSHASRSVSTGLAANKPDSLSYQRSISQSPPHKEDSPTASPPPGISADVDCTCHLGPRAGIDTPITFENVASQSGYMVHQMLEFPSTDSRSVDNESLVLPDICPYLPQNADVKIAAALAALYRSHCISVIDSFRYCKERNLMKYFSAFHGTLTVPVQKLLSSPTVAPWIKECDWLMYQKMIAFVAPLTTQVVPKLVLDAFSSISQRLTTHIAETFKSQPAHVSLARLVPAHIFCNLLKHMLDVNQAANAAAAWLCHSDNRNQMWFDLKTLVDPKEMMLRANIPPCAERATEQILKHDIRALLTPLVEPNPSAGRPFFNQPDTLENTSADKLRVESSPDGEEYNFPDKWIQFILNLPAMFPQHRTQCVIEKVNALWDCILRRLTLGGAQSFSAWWMTKVFFHEMMLWQAEKGGFMKNTPSSLQKSQEAVLGTSNGTESIDSLEKNSGDAGLTANASFMSTDTQHNDSNLRPENRSPEQDNNVQDRKSEQVSLEGGLNRGPSTNDKPTNSSENIATIHTSNNDDSAIDLDDDSMLMSVGKYGDMMASDPADAEGDVVVI